MPLGTLGGFADQAGGLLAQRESLQGQVQGLGAERATSLKALLDAENVLHNLKLELQANTDHLAALQQQQATLESRIASTSEKIRSQKEVLASLTRGSYKQTRGDTSVGYLFSSRTFGQMVTRLMDANNAGRRIAITAKELASQESNLRTAAAGLRTARSQAQAVQASLESEDGRVLALVAEHDARVAQLDAESRDLLARIARVSAAMTAASATPRFTSTSNGGPSSSGVPGRAPASSSSCGNHFDYGYCTWYVAGRRCIPWFGNADEWYANARSFGYPEGSQARVGAVAVWGPGRGMGSVGHVAFVESVQANGFTVSEYNYSYGWNHYDTRFVSNSNPGPLYGFIYQK